MGFKDFANRHKGLMIFFIILGVAVLLFIVALILIINFTPRDMFIRESEAEKIAKREFGCERILWAVDTQITLGSSDPLGENDYFGGNDFLRKTCPNPYKEYKEYYYFDPYVYFIVGEKNGEEIYLLIPADCDRYKPMVAKWPFVASFKEIVKMLHETGINYDVDDKDRWFGLYDREEEIKREAKSYDDVIEDAENLYDRLDVKALLTYSWKENDLDYLCWISQENGEIKIYKSLAWYLK